MKKPTKRHLANEEGVELRTVKRVAELDNCSEKTVRRAIKAGLLEVIRIGPGGRLLRVHPRDHEAYRRTHRE